MDPQSIVLCTPAPWPYRASMDIAPLDDPRVPTSLVLLTELGLPADEAPEMHASNTLTLRLRPADVVARIAPRDRAEDLAIELERAEALLAVGAPVGPPAPRLAPSVHVLALLEECRTLSLALATTWRWGPGGHLPGRPSDRRGVAGRGAGARRGVRPRDRGPSSRIPCLGILGGPRRRPEGSSDD